MGCRWTVEGSDRLDLDLDLDAISDEDTSGFKRPVPRDPEVSPINRGPRSEACAQMTLSIVRAPRTLHLEDNVPLNAADCQGSGEA